MKMQPHNRFTDLTTVVRSLQMVMSLSSKHAARAASNHPLTSTLSKVSSNVSGKQSLQEVSRQKRLRPETLARNSLLVVDNMAQFACAWAQTRSSGMRATPKRTSIDPAERLIEHELNPDVSALDIIQKADLKDKHDVFRTALRPKVTSTSQQPVEGAKERKFMFEDKKLSSQAKETSVPSSRLGRMASFGSLGIGLGLGTVVELSKRAVGVSNSPEGRSPILSDKNAERIVKTLCRVRGAALKLGQILSIQDEVFISPELSEIFKRVRESADFMPLWQMEEVLEHELGPGWKEKHFKDFDKKPFAAASIGQVHSALLHDGRQVAVKIQYPGVAKGIENDISNLLALLSVAGVLPEGLFVDTLIHHMKIELAQECDYIREAKCCRKMKEILSPFPELHVPSVVDAIATKQVFATEMLEGLTIDQCVDLPQETRNFISKSILKLILRELFIFRYMQTDPNWANFLYNPNTNKIGLLDFGATREFRPVFVNNYFKIIDGAASNNRDAVLEYSRKVGFLTGYESQIMNDAHVDSVMILGECFRKNTDFNFGTQKTTQRMQELVPVMLKHRLCPPPPEVYSLHRKMSGLFLLAAKLGAEINCYPIWKEISSQFRTHSEE